MGGAQGNPIANLHNKSSIYIFYAHIFLTVARFSSDGSAMQYVVYFGFNNLYSPYIPI